MYGYKIYDHLCKLINNPSDFTRLKNIGQLGATVAKVGRQTNGNFVHQRWRVLNSPGNPGKLKPFKGIMAKIATYPFQNSFVNLRGFV